MARNALSLHSGEDYVEDTKGELERFTYTPTDIDLAEAFGGGSEYFFFSRPPLGWSSVSRMFEQEED